MPLDLEKQPVANPSPAGASRSMGLWIGLALVLLVGGLGAYFFSRGSTTPPPATESSAPSTAGDIATGSAELASATSGSQQPDATAVGSGDVGSSDTATSNAGPESTPSEKAVNPAAAIEATAPSGMSVPAVTSLAGSGPTAGGSSHATTPSDPSKTLLTVQFRRGSVSISEADRRRLRELVAECNRKNTPAVLLEGYGCSLGSTAVNHELGTKRARAVEQYLQQLGLKARLDMVSFGSDFPVSDNETEDSRAKNRRVVASVSGG